MWQKKKLITSRFGGPKDKHCNLLIYWLEWEGKKCVQDDCLEWNFSADGCQILVLLTNNEEKLIGVKGDCRQILSICDVCARESCDCTSIRFKLTIMQTCVYVSNSCNAAAESKLICFREGELVCSSRDITHVSHRD